PLREHRLEERLVTRLGVEIGHAGCEIERAHRMTDDRAGPANGLAVLVVGKVETPVGEEAVAASPGELVREVEIAPIRGLAVQLDERDLDLGVTVRPWIRVGAEHLDEQVADATGDAEEAGRARTGRSDAGLDQVPRAVELVPHLEVAP